jgi:hypothetical protein
MANRTKKGRGSRPQAGRRAGALRTKEGPACPGELNLPRPSRHDYVAGVVEQLREFEERLGELEFELESAGWNDEGGRSGGFDDIRLRLKAARAKSEELEAALDADWPALYGEMEESLLDVAGRLEDLASELGWVLPG